MTKPFDSVDTYDDIINLPHYRSKHYPPMSLEKRAAQFSPFAALSGHEEAIKEKARLTEQKIELSDSQKAKLNARLLLLKKHLKNKPTVTVTYFVPDEQKSGGTYVTKTGSITKIAEHEHFIALQHTNIPMEDILRITGSIFEITQEVVKGK